ncbi:hypothetical protein BKA93DRAFT_791828 [Sparassis latifolia]
MPAERSMKRTKRSSPMAEGELTWAVSAEPPTFQPIMFTENLTPETFNEPPPKQTPSKSSLVPSDGDALPHPAGHKLKKPDGHVPRPCNPFILFRGWMIKQNLVPRGVEGNHSTLSSILGKTWRSLSEPGKQVWRDKARMELDRHKAKYPDYVFKPEHLKEPSASPRRKVREVGLKDEKRCEAIAALLVQGKSGDELAAAMEEFDKNHVPEVVTRFDAPVTAGAYSRGSSGPVRSARKGKGRKRAASSQATCSEPSSASSSLASLSRSSSISLYESSASSSSSPWLPSDHIAPSAGPTFDPNMFGSFDEYLPSASSPCEPLTTYPNALEFFPQGSQDPGSSQAVTFHPPMLHVNTSYAWSSDSSTFSSGPGTPSSFAGVSATLHPDPAMGMVDLNGQQQIVEPFDPASFGYYPENVPGVDGSYGVPSVIDVLEATQFEPAKPAYLPTYNPPPYPPPGADLFDQAFSAYMAANSNFAF